MELNDEIRIPAKLDFVYKSLNDLHILQTCIPGCEELIEGQDGTLSATEDNTLSNTDYYRYYVLRLQSTGGTYDFGLDKTKWYGDYY